MNNRSIEGGRRDLGRVGIILLVIFFLIPPTFGTSNANYREVDAIVGSVHITYNITGFDGHNLQFDNHSYNRSDSYQVRLYLSIDKGIFVWVDYWKDGRQLNPVDGPSLADFNWQLTNLGLRGLAYSNRTISGYPAIVAHYPAQVDSQSSNGIPEGYYVSMVLDEKTSMDIILRGLSDSEAEQVLNSFKIQPLAMAA